MVRSTDFPIEERGRVRTGTDLRIAGEDGHDRGRLGRRRRRGGAGPDRHGLPDGTCVPNAQHAVRQAKRLAKNLYAVRYGVGQVKEYKHKNLGAVAGLRRLEGRRQDQWASSSRARRPGSRTAATTAWPCRPSSASSASSSAGSGLLQDRDTTQLSDLQNPRRPFVAAAAPAPKPAAAAAARCGEAGGRGRQAGEQGSVRPTPSSLQLPSTAAVPLRGSGRRRR